MRGSVVIDTNLMVLLVVGAVAPGRIATHRRLNGYTSDDFELLGLIIAEFSEIITLPHILAETSTLIDSRERAALRSLVEGSIEFPEPSKAGCERVEFSSLGLTDAMILHVCCMRAEGLAPTLLTADTPLANVASSLGVSVIDYRSEYHLA